MNEEKIAKLIIEMRKKNNLTQKELGELLNVTSQAISKWENARGIPDIEMLKKLSEVFHIPIDDLLKGEKKKQKKKPYIYLSIVILLIILMGIFILLKNHNEPFYFYRLATDNDAFRIKGVIAYNKNKKSIYISEVTYDLKDEEKYYEIECILFERTSNVERLLSKWGEIKYEKKEERYLTDLLKELEFNIDAYDCDCKEESCNHLYLRINALSDNNKVITYLLPLQIDTLCTE